MKIGDKVALVDDLIQGEIIEIKKIQNIYIVKTQDGLELPFDKEQLVCINDEIYCDKREILQVINEKELLKKRKNKLKTTKKISIWEVDLHIEKLTTHWRKMTPYDKLILQIETARYKLELAIEKGIQKIVFIHGVGQGVLRTELEYLFSRYRNITFYDADFSKYGQGATELNIYQKEI